MGTNRGPNFQRSMSSLRDQGGVVLFGVMEKALAVVLPAVLAFPFLELRQVDAERREDGRQG